uniref:Reverse transcriptase domain-containing protein n=1 Tax=Trichogramma kaykai TaxID=54128 RepID=A0ABD2W4E0_9HYME
MYDRILRLELPRSAKIVGFADDIAITVVAKHLDIVEYYSNETIGLVRAALTELGLHTADQKTEVLLVTSRKVTETITVRAGDHYIMSASCIRYLDVHIAARL